MGSFGTKLILSNKHHTLDDVSVFVSLLIQIRALADVIPEQILNILPFHFVWQVRHVDPTFMGIGASTLAANKATELIPVLF